MRSQCCYDDSLLGANQALPNMIVSLCKRLSLHGTLADHNLPTQQHDEDLWRKGCVRGLAVATVTEPHQLSKVGDLCGKAVREGPLAGVGILPTQASSSVKSAVQEQPSPPSVSSRTISPPSGVPS
jgi:hypothetical protein